MQHPAQERSRTATRIGRLLLVLSLAACVDQADNAGGTADSTAVPAAGAPQAQAASGARAPGKCTPSPAVREALLANGAPWQTLASWMDSTGVTFVDTNPDSSVAMVRLCKMCNPVRLRIVSEAKTYCNGAGNLRDSTRLAGVWVVQEGTVTPPNWGATFSRGDSIFVFSHGHEGSARVVYPVGNKVQRAPADAWSFFLCNDGHANNRPQGKWRNKTTGATVTDSDTPPGDGEDPGTYGWMACASGCCQFYIPPTPVIEPEPDASRANGAPGRPQCLPASH